MISPVLQNDNISYGFGERMINCPYYRDNLTLYIPLSCVIALFDDDHWRTLCADLANNSNARDGNNVLITANAAVYLLSHDKDGDYNTFRKNIRDKQNEFLIQCDVDGNNQTNVPVIEQKPSQPQRSRCRVDKTNNDPHVENASAGSSLPEMTLEQTMSALKDSMFPSVRNFMKDILRDSGVTVDRSMAAGVGADKVTDNVMDNVMKNTPIDPMQPGDPSDDEFLTKIRRTEREIKVKQAELKVYLAELELHRERRSLESII